MNLIGNAAKPVCKGQERWFKDVVHSDLPAPLEVYFQPCARWKSLPIVSEEYPDPRLGFPVRCRIGLKAYC